MRVNRTHAVLKWPAAHRQPLFLFSAGVKMAYARFSRHSDVYVYESNQGGWVCCLCSRNEGRTTATATRSEMIERLQQHETNGDKVPAEAIEELRNEIETLGDSTARS
jgi:hypothetical protein